VKKPIIHFIISALIGLGLGYVVFDVIGGDKSEEQPSVATEQTKPDEAKTEEKTEPAAEQTASGGEENILQTKGCLGCHSVESLNLKGGATGPDLSQAFNNVEGKHGKPVAEFLKEPTSAVMSGVIGGNPLTDEEISSVVKVLEEASKAK